MSIIHVHSEADWHNCLKGNKLVIVKFGAEWCGPCKQIAPKYAQFATEHPNIVCLEVDIEELEDLPECRNVRGVPTFKFYKKGKMLEEFSGANLAKLIETAKKHS